MTTKMASSRTVELLKKDERFFHPFGVVGVVRHFGFSGSIEVVGVRSGRELDERLEPVFKRIVHGP